MLLKDRVALVTGAGRGWGQAVAMAYARQGATVIAVSRTQSELDTTARLVEAAGGCCVTMSVDVAREDAVQAMAERILEQFGGLDILVNNAGVLILKTFEELSVEEWDRTLAVNLRGPILACKAFLDTMKRQGGGSIINVSSGAGAQPFTRESAYCASKFALEGFSRTLALEVQPYNIAVNTITPGRLPGGGHIKPTSITQAEYDAMSEAERGQWSDAVVLTEAFVFLALQRGDGVTGQRVSAGELSAQIRREGWGIEYRPVEC